MWRPAEGMQRRNNPTHQQRQRVLYQRSGSAPQAGRRGGGRVTLQEVMPSLDGVKAPGNS